MSRARRWGLTQLTCHVRSRPSGVPSLASNIAPALLTRTWTSARGPSKPSAKARTEANSARSSRRHSTSRLPVSSMMSRAATAARFRRGTPGRRGRPRARTPAQSPCRCRCLRPSRRKACQSCFRRGRRPSRGPRARAAPGVCVPRGHRQYEGSLRPASALPTRPRVAKTSAGVRARSAPGPAQTRWRGDRRVESGHACRREGLLTRIARRRAHVLRGGVRRGG